MRIFQLITVILMTCCLFACSNNSRPVYAPVSEVSTIDPIPKNGEHRVASHETIYSIAWRYGLDYQAIVKLNHLVPPYALQPEQLIYLKKTASTLKAIPQPVPEDKDHMHPVIVEPVSVPAAPPVAVSPSPPKSSRVVAPTPRVVQRSVPAERGEPTKAVTTWYWPARGTVVGTYSASNKGINIAGRLGDPVFATAAGKVVYSGDGLRGYGNLIIIKHNRTFLTAYAHNSVLLVHDGDWVKAGQRIAEMGNTGTRRVMLHFEIRRSGQPVNPLIYLSERPKRRV